MQSNHLCRSKEQGHRRPRAPGYSRVEQSHRSDCEPLCVFVFAPTVEGAYSRMFAPLYGISEDAATGSSTGPLASFMMRNCLTPGTRGRRLVSEQGTKMGRRSTLHVCIQGENG